MKRCMFLVMIIGNFEITNVESEQNLLEIEQRPSQEAKGRYDPVGLIVEL